MMNDIEKFIERRFGGKDCDWKSGNCYYFAVILKTRFPQGDIYYDTIDGHFLFRYGSAFYDFGGTVDMSDKSAGAIIDWSIFKSYDPKHYERIVRDCIL